jgi:hypothetical protein
MKLTFLITFLVIKRNLIFASTLTDFLGRIAENRAEQICFVSFGLEHLLDFQDNTPKSLENIPRIVYDKPNVKDRWSIGLRKCDLTFVEFSDYDSVSSFLL